MEILYSNKIDEFIEFLRIIIFEIRFIFFFIFWLIFGLKLFYLINILKFMI